MKTKRKYIRSVSNRRARELRIYKTLRAWFLAEHPWCAWGLLQNPPVKIRSNEIHHMRGRAGRMLNLTQFWAAVSAQGHLWINQNPAAARALGLLCEKGLWNNPK